MICLKPPPSSRWEQYGELCPRSQVSCSCQTYVLNIWIDVLLAPICMRRKAPSIKNGITLVGGSVFPYLPTNNHNPFKHTATQIVWIVSCLVWPQTTCVGLKVNEGFIVMLLADLGSPGSQCGVRGRSSVTAFLLGHGVEVSLQVSLFSVCTSVME